MTTLELISVSLSLWVPMLIKKEEWGSTWGKVFPSQLLKLLGSTAQPGNFKLCFPWSWYLYHKREVSLKCSLCSFMYFPGGAFPWHYAVGWCLVRGIYGRLMSWQRSSLFCGLRIYWQKPEVCEPSEPVCSTVHVANYTVFWRKFPCVHPVIH